MSRHNRNSKKDPMKLSKKQLLPYEYRQYKQIGEPDLSQNWLELFTPVIVSDLFEIMHSCSNNPQKAEYIEEAMGYYGFKEVSLGTNIYTMWNPAYPGVVFKFALDDNGLADNFNDTILQDLIPRYARTLARHPSAIVSVQERKVVVADQDRMDTFRSSILKTLNKLAKDYLIVDLSPTIYHLNYGIERNGDWCFIDASDLYPLTNMPDKVRCNKAIGYDDKKKRVRRCGGRLRYNPDFSAIICTKCGSEYLPLEIRPKDKEDKGKMANAMTDGMSFDEREKMIAEEMSAIRGSTVRSEVREEKPPKLVEPIAESVRCRSAFVDPNEDDPGVLVIERGKPLFSAGASTTQQYDDEDDEPVQRVVMADDDREEDPSGEFTIVNYNGTNEDEAGIYLHLSGDPMKALENCAVPIFLSIGDRTEITQILGATPLIDLLRPLVQDTVEDREMIRREMKERYNSSGSDAEEDDDSESDDEE